MKPLQAILISVFLAVIGQILMKSGMLKIGEITLHRSNVFMVGVKIFTNPIIILGLLFYAVSAFLWLVGLSKVELSFAYPLVAITYVFIPILSHLIFKEHLSLMRIIALIIIIIGVCLLSRS